MDRGVLRARCRQQSLLLPSKDCSAMVMPSHPNLPMKMWMERSSFSLDPGKTNNWKRIQHPNVSGCRYIQMMQQKDSGQRSNDTPTHSLIAWTDGGWVMQHQNLCFKFPWRLRIQPWRHHHHALPDRRALDLEVGNQGKQIHSSRFFEANKHPWSCFTNGRPQEPLKMQPPQGEKCVAHPPEHNSIKQDFYKGDGRKKWEGSNFKVVSTKLLSSRQCQAW